MILRSHQYRIHEGRLCSSTFWILASISILPSCEVHADACQDREGNIVSRVGADELIRLRAAEPGLIEIARKLASYKVPFTLCHGDMHLGNVALCDGRYAFFDWGEGCVSHPFLDAVHFAHESEFESFPEEEYCALWSAYETAERLREALSLARPLCSLIETMSQYHACVHLRPEPEEFPECLTAGLQTLMAEATA